ncbi:MAG: glucuronate isomerase [Ruminococcaceae bacterium]|nr:glucuronate isomerase [Oscillospiraceae bacterium]
MSYIKNNFLLDNKTAEKLYFDYAKEMPIFDYHCHLPEKQILENKKFNDVFEIWLAGDHYKWRLMRNYGVNEEYITGNKSNKEKFVTYCTVLGTAFGNPLYHWSQVELKEYFGCELEINAQNSEAIWEMCNEYIRKNEITPQSLIESSNVTHVFTTNEVFDDLTTFEKIKEKGYKFEVIPAFRADKIMNIEAKGYLTFLGKLQELTHKISSLNDLEKALEIRLQAFLSVGCRASDIAVENVYVVPSKEEADAVLKSVLAGNAPSVQESEVFKGYVTYFLMKLYARYNVSTELHFGAMRNNNAVMLEKLGLDTGFDSISDKNSISNLSRLMDKLNSEGALPKLIIFNLNPKMNAEIMSLLGCFQNDEARGKIQYGPAWWFLDNKIGMEKHLEDLCATGHIATFVGMLTDSRSLLSYPRHHYFRRILCTYLGTLIEKGEMTQNLDLVGAVVKDICYNNAIKYFNI